MLLHRANNKQASDNYSRPHTVWEGCYVLRMWFFFISASLISAVRQTIWLKFGTLTGSWFKLWSPVPNGGYPPEKILEAKIWKISNSAYSSELITLERKRISARLKRPWNRKKMAY